jgi:RimJ/RimL family protein N-acetyltransferase
MPWAMHEPASLEETQARLTVRAESFANREEFAYTIFNGAETEVFGAAGLHRRAEADCLEIGYWIRSDQIDQGFATEATRALSISGLQMTGISRVQIDCDPRNLRSIRVPEKLGYRLVQRQVGNKLTPAGEPRDTLVFELSEVTQIPSLG